MLLRDSKFKGESSLGMVQTLAQAGKGEDPYGYRAEFLQLVNRTNATEAYR
jgi:Ca-activated chloride channel family protein